MLLHPVRIFFDPSGVPCGHIGSIFVRFGSRVWGLGFGPYIFLYDTKITDPELCDILPVDPGPRQEIVQSADLELYTRDGHTSC